ncbi:potassium channel subfamily K member 18-like [Ptychodera flava]|uniref:potassium channel subfamily K member 18-like n=1 Tax=Ptychodera flava TaxID=63121 RepID=UPI00396A620E
MAAMKRSSNNWRSWLFSDSGICLMLAVLVVSYITLGAAVFSYIEGSHYSRWMSATQDAINSTMLQVLDRVCVNHTSDRLEHMLELLEHYHELVELRHHRFLYQDWSLLTAGFFCVTVITTIGYGYMVPLGTSGRYFCLFYALIGIPLNLIFLSRIGHQMGRATKVSVAMVRKKLCKYGKEENGADKGQVRRKAVKEYGDNWTLRGKSRPPNADQFNCKNGAKTRLPQWSKQRDRIDCTTDKEKQEISGVSDNICLSWKYCEHTKGNRYKAKTEINGVWPLQPEDYQCESEMQCVEMTWNVDSITRSRTELSLAKFSVIDAGSDLPLENSDTTSVEVDVACKSWIPRTERRTSSEIFAIYTPTISQTNLPKSAKRERTVHTQTESCTKLLNGEVEEKSKKSDDVPVTILASMLFGYVLLGALVFHLTQGWSFLTATYFCVITLTTIGFGDVELHISSNDPEYVRVFTCLLLTAYIFCGMALLSTCLDLTQVRIIAVGKRLLKHSSL